MRKVTFAHIGLVAAAIAASTVASAPALGEPCGGEVRLRTLHIEAHPNKKKVHRGERLTVHFTVTRPAHEDPLGQGIEFEPPVSLPAADIPIGITVFAGEYSYFWDMGKTDENGEETLHPRVPKDSETGWSLAVATGKKYQTQVCPEIVEEGYRHYTDFVKVVP